LRDCDFGRWAGRNFENVQAQEPDALADWLSDPNAAPHGGESFAAVMTRVGGWMEGLVATSGVVLAVTHATVIRAAIARAVGAGPEMFRHLDVPPLSRTKLSSDGGRWTLAALVPLKETM
jgi:broad specificity phosphatase PhoE